MYDTFWLVNIDNIVDSEYIGQHSFDDIDEAFDYIREVIDNTDNESAVNIRITRTLIYHAEADELDDVIDDVNRFDEFEDDEDDEYDDY